MKKILWILAVLVLFFVGDRIAGFVLKKMTMSSQFRYARLYQDKAQSDILFVGNSRGLIFYQPYAEEISKLETFNLSYNGMPMDLANVMVQDYFEKYKAPKHMIVDVTICDRDNKQLISSFNLYTPFSKRLDALMKTRNPKVHYGGKLSHLYRHNSEVFQRGLVYLNKSDEDWLLDRVITDFLVEDVKNLEPYIIDADDKKTEDVNEEKYLMEELAAMVKLAQSKGTKVSLVINPYFPAFADKMTNLQEFKTKIEKATGLAVVDYSKAVTDTKGFGDYQHLNKYGAKLFLDQLKKDKILP